MVKTYKLQASDIKPLATGRGGCVATDGIVVEGRLVGVMERHPTDRPNDSGWLFQGAGDSPEALDDPTRWGVYDVNTLANYDPDILPFLDSPVGTVCLRDVNGIVRLSDAAAKAFLSR